MHLWRRSSAPSGTALVGRGPEGLRLTPIGESLLPIIEEAARAVSAIERAVIEQIARALGGAVGLHAAHHTGARRPARSLHLSHSSSSAARGQSISKKAKLIWPSAYGPVTDSDLRGAQARRQRLVTLRFRGVLTSTNTRPQTDIDDLSGHDLIGYDPSLSTVPRQMGRSARQGRQRHITQPAGNDRHGQRRAEQIGLAVFLARCGVNEPGLAPHRKVVATQVTGLSRAKRRALEEMRYAVIAYVISVMKPMQIWKIQADL